MQTKPYQPSLRSQISHELRIPLTGILGMIHFLENTKLTEEQRDYLGLIQLSAERLLAAQNKIDGLLKKENDNASS